jgi:hypothetical protein
LPVVRNGKQATLEYQSEVWKTWKWILENNLSIERRTLGEISLFVVIRSGGFFFFEKSLAALYSAILAE